MPKGEPGVKKKTKPEKKTSIKQFNSRKESKNKNNNTTSLLEQRQNPKRSGQWVKKVDETFRKFEKLIKKKKRGYTIWKGRSGNKEGKKRGK